MPCGFLLNVGSGRHNRRACGSSGDLIYHELFACCNFNRLFEAIWCA
ncbi:hypothetical protein T12_4336, partial [Trichinella patagoniensis]